MDNYGTLIIYAVISMIHPASLELHHTRRVVQRLRGVSCTQVQELANQHAKFAADPGRYDYVFQPDARWLDVSG